MKYKIPYLKEILKPEWSHSVGYGVKGKSKCKIDFLEQGTTPKDTKLLKKLGIKKGEKILAIASYYASWAKELQKAGVKIDYSDISKSIVNWVKKNVKAKFGKYICSNYELIPKKTKEYDWTFTYEACGGGRGLPLAYLRSLLNTKGGILIIHLGDKKHQLANASKLKRYPNIVKTLSQIYDTKFFIVKRKINAHKRGEKNIENYKFLISKIKTNNFARKKAELDIKVLDYINTKNKINLKEISKNFNTTKKESKNSLERLNKLAKVINEKFLKKIELKPKKLSPPTRALLGIDK